jgi:2-C-methyl-D-erythritol 4-phosphate cytidylyltransferase
VSSVRAAAVLLAAGSGTRVGGEVNKVLLPLAGTPAFVWSLRTIASLPCIERVVVVVRPEDRRLIQAHLAGHELVVDGGRHRHASEWQALQAIAADVDSGGIDVVAIHDAARPLADARLWREVIQVAAERGAALPTRDQHAVMRRDGTRVDERLVAVQTPQAFRAPTLLDAYRRADTDGFHGTDTASCVERYAAVDVACVPAPATNLKITFPEDVEVAGRLVER